jgi:hypothetical protein
MATMATVTTSSINVNPAPGAAQESFEVVGVFISA